VGVGTYLIWGWGFRGLGDVYRAVSSFYIFAFGGSRVFFFWFLKGWESERHQNSKTKKDGLVPSPQPYENEKYKLILTSNSPKIK
jgi:hypothetical protein